MLAQIFIMAVFNLEMTVQSNYTVTSWNYDDESSWPGVLCQEGAGGRRQSPIDIKTEEAQEDHREEFIKYGQLKFNGYNRVLLTGINNGHTILFSCEGDESIHPTLTGGPLKHIYRLEQLHFHWLSEHAIDGRKYPLEIHFVHIRADMTVRQALTQRDGLAIIAVFGTVAADLDDVELQKTQEFMLQLPRLDSAGTRVSGLVLDVMSLLSPVTNSYYTYEGSLTSPECNEVVIWIIYDKPIIISDSHYRLFAKVGIGRHNFRSLRPMQHHKVYTPVPPSVWTTPYLIVLLNDMFRSVSGFFRNITEFISHDIIKKKS